MQNPSSSDSLPPALPKNNHPKSVLLKIFHNLSLRKIQIIITSILAILFVIGFCFMIFSKIHRTPSDSDTPPASPDPEATAEVPAGPTPPDQTPDSELSQTPTFIDLQPTVDNWLKSVTANVGLMIYDLDNQRVAAEYQPDKIFDIASIYKLFYVYTGYRQIDGGARSGDAKFVTTTDYRAGDYTLYQCLDLMIRESYNGCADPMRENRYYSIRAAALIDELELNNTTNLGLSSTAADLTKLLELYWRHPDLSDDSWARLSSSMLEQPPTTVATNTTYNWRQGLPSGFSEEVNIYDKVGWEWDGSKWLIYADAAIVEFPDLNRHYTVVVLTSGITSARPTILTRLGQQLEQTITNTNT